MFIRLTNSQHTQPMTKRAYDQDVPTFPDDSGWSPKPGALRGKVVNPSNPNCGQYYWSITANTKLTYFEYEDIVVRDVAAKAYLAKKSLRGSGPKAAPPASPTFAFPDDSVLRGMETDMKQLHKDIIAVKVELRDMRETVFELMASISNLTSLCEKGFTVKN